MYCGKCGTLNEDTAKFCKSCGTNMFFEKNRGELDSSFFTITVYVMLGLVAFSLLYYILSKNSDESLLNKESVYSIINYNTI